MDEDPASTSCAPRPPPTTSGSGDSTPYGTAKKYSSLCPQVQMRCYYCVSRETERKLRRCGGCGVVLYCSKECQKKAWPEHKCVHLPIAGKYHQCRTGVYDDVALTTLTFLDTRKTCRPGAALMKNRDVLQESLGIPAPISLTHAVMEWVEAHTHAFHNIASCATILDGGLERNLASPHALVFRLGLALVDPRGNPSRKFGLRRTDVVPRPLGRRLGRMGGAAREARQDAQHGPACKVRRGASRCLPGGGHPGRCHVQLVPRLPPKPPQYDRRRAYGPACPAGPAQHLHRVRERGAGVRFRRRWRWKRKSAGVPSPRRLGTPR
ncbi:hypothetical protein BV20DRAFT_803781 [Pilatotrama ljubarskyi]|nr:hypothetical protein BV20DRAFT_803781 [Pilatotrama ljubarskyi]